jgi:hypothetical protein
MTDTPTETMNRPIRKYLVPCPACGKHLSMLMLPGGDVEGEVDGAIIHKPCGSHLKLIMILVQVPGTEDPRTKALISVKEQEVQPPPREITKLLEGYG